MKIFVVGSNGMLGGEVVRQLEADGEFSIVKSDYSDQDGIDITDPDSVAAYLQEHQPDFIINCAAYTNVEAAEAEVNRKIAFEVNRDGVVNLVRSALEHNCGLIHISTDYVFGDEKEEGYSENYTRYNPLNVYGESKTAGEQEMILLLDGLQESDFINQDPKMYLVRTSALYGKGATNFIAKIIQYAKEKDSLKVVTDEIVKPTYTKDLVKALIYLLKDQPAGGIYHGTSQGHCSRFQFAKEILKQAKIDTPIYPTTLSEFKREAKIPHISLLLNTKLPHLRDWREMVADYINSEL